MNGTVRSWKSAPGCSSSYPPPVPRPSKAVKPLGGVEVGGKLPSAGQGMNEENEPMGTEDFKELYFIADQRGRIESCLSEIGAF